MTQFTSVTRFQNFYEHGERERMLTELSELRDQVKLILSIFPTLVQFTFNMEHIMDI